MSSSALVAVRLDKKMEKDCLARFDALIEDYLYPLQISKHNPMTQSMFPLQHPQGAYSLNKDAQVLLIDYVL